MPKIRKRVSAYLMSQSSFKHAFYICMVVIAGLLFALLVLYFYNFNGPLSTDVSDWADFSSFITGFVTMLFSGLSVWVVFSIESTMLERNKQERTFELQLRIVNSFERWIYRFFNPNDIESTASFDEDLYIRSKDFLKRLELYSDILPFLKSQEYKDFQKIFDDFAYKYHDNFPDEWQNSGAEREAYDICEQARHILLNLSTNLIK